MAGVIVWPGNQINRQPTINAARGLNRKIADRFDLTLETIRRPYAGEQSPLSATLKRYSDFFALFEDFPKYVEFFHLQNLVTFDGAVRFFAHFDDFQTHGVPPSAEAYAEFRLRHTEFLLARRQRIASAG